MTDEEIYKSILACAGIDEYSDASVNCSRCPYRIDCFGHQDKYIMWANYVKRLKKENSLLKKKLESYENKDNNSCEKDIIETANTKGTPHIQEKYRKYL